MENLNLEINMYELDKHLEEQPSLFGFIAEKLVNATAERDGIKADLEYLEAELDTKIRKKALEDKEKLTEKAVLSRILLENDRSLLFQDLEKAQKEMNFLNAQKQSLEYRKKSLEGLVQLYIADWFSEVNAKVSPEKRAEFNETKAEIQQKDNVNNTKTGRRKRMD